MGRIPTTGALGLFLSLSLVSGAAPSALADLTDYSSARAPFGSGTTFRLRVHFDERTAPEMVISDGYKRPPKVDSRLVSQIYDVRLAFPSWHGLHSLPPGATGGGQ